jgi:hypothetical protein
MAPPAAKLLTGFFIAAALLVVAVAIFTLSQPAPMLPPLPQPNGYDDFVKAGGMITDRASDYGTMSEEQLRAFVKKNAEALKLARAGIGRECRVPLDYSPTNDVIISRLAAMKRLAQALTSEGRLAELENRPADAAEAYLAVIHLGHAMCQGGLIIDSLVGIAIEAIGTTGMQRLAPALDAKQCREAAVALESSESQREPTEAIWARDRIRTHRRYGFKWLIVRLFQFRSLKQNEQIVAAKITTHQTRAQALLIQLAARAYELEKGQHPKSLADLVPAYLKTIPQDPGAGTNPAYFP